MRLPSSYESTIHEMLDGLHSLVAELSAETNRHYSLARDPGQESEFVLMEDDDCDGWPMRRYSTVEECRAGIQHLLMDPSPLDRGRNPNIVEIEMLLDQQSCS